MKNYNPPSQNLRGCDPQTHRIDNYDGHDQHRANVKFLPTALYLSIALFKVLVQSQG